MKFTYAARQSSIVECRAGVGAVAVGREVAFADPLVTAYEITPFTFILDWFLNLGQAIEAWSPFAGTEWKYFWVSRKFIERLDYYCYPWKLDNDDLSYEAVYVAGDTSHADAEFTSYTRSPIVPLPNLSVDLNFDLPKAVDLAAVVGLWRAFNWKTFMGRR